MSDIGTRRGRSELDDEAKVKAMENLWVNALTAIGMPDKLCLELGRLVLEKLRDSDIELDDLGIRHGRVVYLEVVSS